MTVSQTMSQTKRNAYSCTTCGQTIITDDIDQGTTPFIVGCRATKGCEGVMHSHFYRGPVVESDEPATFIWRKPTKAEYQKASSAMKQHFDMGGLDIYRSKAGREPF